MEKNLTEGSVPKRLLGFSLPYLLSYFLQTLYGMADLLIIGRYGTVSDTTAVSIGSQVMHMLTVMIVGLAMGTTVCVGRSVGGKRRDRAAGYIGNTAVLFVGGVARTDRAVARACLANRLGNVHACRRCRRRAFISDRMLYRHTVYNGIQCYKLDIPRHGRLAQPDVLYRRGLRG